MRLSLFYPFAFALIAAMVWFALRPGFARTAEWRAVLDEAAANGFVVDGARLESLVLNERATIELAGPSNARRAIIGSHGEVTGADNNGVHYFTPADITRALAAPALEVTFEVRSPPELGSLGWLGRCLIAGAFDTGWKPMEVSYEWSVQSLRCPTGGYRGSEPLTLIIWSDANGDGGAIELRRIVIAPAGAEPAASAEGAS